MSLYKRYKKWFLMGIPLVILLLSCLIFIKKPDYNGKYISSLTPEDKTARLLLDDIKEFNKKYNGKGGIDDSDLQVVIYKIKPGDSLWNIAKKTGLSIDSLLSLNKLRNVHIIQPGTEIRIPNKDGVFYKVSPGETIESIAKEFKVPAEDIIDVNDISEDSLEEGKDIFIPKGRLDLKQRINLLGRFLMPVFGRITSGFGWRRNPITHHREFHRGLDIANACGTRVQAAESGIVIFTGIYKGYGNLVILKHSNGYSTRYGHLSRINVKYGQRVRQGGTIGYVGSTGLSTGCHLHFEIRLYGRALNPFFMLRYYAKK